MRYLAPLSTLLCGLFIIGCQQQEPEEVEQEDETETENEPKIGALVKVSKDSFRAPCAN